MNFSVSSSKWRKSVLNHAIIVLMSKLVNLGKNKLRHYDIVETEFVWSFLCIKYCVC